MRISEAPRHIMKRSNSPKPDNLLESVRASVAQQGHERYLMESPLIAAVSGGADSLAMLHVLCERRGPLAAQTIHVAHLDHCFRAEASEQDAAFVREVATSLGLQCT